MQKVHPYAQAEYTVFEQPDKSFGVTIVTPESSPASVTPFPSKSAAEAWIEAHKARVALQAPDMRNPNRFRRPVPRRAVGTDSAGVSAPGATEAGSVEAGRGDA